MHTYCIGARTFTFRVPHCYYGRPACASSSPSHVSASAWRRKKKKTARWRECLFFSPPSLPASEDMEHFAPSLSHGRQTEHRKRRRTRRPGEGERERERERGRRSERGGEEEGERAAEREVEDGEGEEEEKGAEVAEERRGLTPALLLRCPSVPLSLSTAAIFDGWAAASPARSRRMKSNNRGAESPPPFAFPPPPPPPPPQGKTSFGGKKWGGRPKAPLSFSASDSGLGLASLNSSLQPVSNKWRLVTEMFGATVLCTWVWE